MLVVHITIRVSCRADNESLHVTTVLLVLKAHSHHTITNVALTGKMGMQPIMPITVAI